MKKEVLLSERCQYLLWSLLTFSSPPGPLQDPPLISLWKISNFLLHWPLFLVLFSNIIGYWRDVCVYACVFITKGNQLIASGNQLISKGSLFFQAQALFSRNRSHVLRPQIKRNKRNNTSLIAIQRKKMYSLSYFMV